MARPTPSTVLRPQSHAADRFGASAPQASRALSCTGRHVNDRTGTLTHHRPRRRVVHGNAERELVLSHQLPCELRSNPPHQASDSLSAPEWLRPFRQPVRVLPASEVVAVSQHGNFARLIRCVYSARPTRRLSAAFGWMGLVAAYRQSRPVTCVTEACDDFSITSPVLAAGRLDFADMMIPELRWRGLFCTEQEGSTSRVILAHPATDHCRCNHRPAA